jgi:hypothetical protein
MENKSTHFTFDGEKIVISPDLILIINFLQEIEKEIKSFLSFNHCTRSKIIILFANLETLLRLNFAYENKITDGEKIRKLTMKQEVWRSFYDDFCLNKNNKWVKANSERATHITAEELRYLRNSLTHFFSLDEGLQIADNLLNNKLRRLEAKTNFKAKFISPEDLYENIKGAAKLMIEKWNEDCKKSLRKNSDEFKEKILAVNKLIKNCGVIVVKGEQIDI